MEPQRYYKLANIKSTYLAHEYLNEGLKEYVRDSYFGNLFFIFNFEEIYVDDMHVVINDNDFKKIIEPIEPYIKNKNESAKIKSIKLSKDAVLLEDPSNSYIIGRFTRNFVANNSKKGLVSIRNSAFRFKRHIRNLKKMMNANLIVSFDFEYNGLNFHNVSEVGISLYYPQRDETIYLYYVIDESKVANPKKVKLRNSFHFGKTVVAKRKDVYNELMMYIKEADYLIAHDINNEMQILKIKPNWDKVIDTKYCELVLNPQEKYLSLQETLRKNDISCSHLHNAGNDAAYALELAITMYDSVKEEAVS